jgi:phosphoglycolate phosphatase
MPRAGMKRLAPPRALLFDLDGTLIDSAPDLAGAINELRARRGLEPCAYERLRPMVGRGARGMVGAAFGLGPGEPGFDALRDEFLELYAARSLRLTRVFDAMQPVLQAIEARGLRWGIVTNKAERLTRPIVAGLALERRAAAVVSGDSTPHSKPHPGPLLEAARQLDLAPSECAYIGDDLRDVQAGRAAGMPTMIAAWGYLGAEDDPIERWGADAIAQQPDDVLKVFGLA